MKDEANVLDFLKREEGMISGIRNLLVKEDQVSNKISESSLLMKNAEVGNDARKDN